MAFKHKLGMRRYRRRYRRKRPSSYGYNPSRWFPRVALAPDAMRVKLRFSENFQLIGGAALDSRVYRLNGAGDPTVTAPLVGRQPIGFDVWKQLYSRYYVPSANVTIHMAARPGELPMQSDVFDNYNIVIYPSPLQTVVGDIETLQSRGRCLKRLLTKNDNLVAKWKYTTKSITGIRWNDAQTARTDDPATPWPLEQSFLHVVAQNVTKATTPGAVDFMITIDYNIIFYQKQPVIDQDESSTV